MARLKQQHQDNYRHNLKRMSLSCVFDHRCISSQSLVLLKNARVIYYASILGILFLTQSRDHLFSLIAHSTTPAFMDEFRTQNKADPTTRNKNSPNTTGPTGIFSSRDYMTRVIRQNYPYLCRTFSGAMHLCLVDLSSQFLSPVKSLYKHDYCLAITLGLCLVDRQHRVCEYLLSFPFELSTIL